MGIINNQVVSRSHEVRFDSGRHPLGKIGFVLLATEQTVADDMSTLIPAGVGVHYARLNNPDSITRESLAAVEPDLVKVSASLRNARLWLWTRLSPSGRRVHSWSKPDWSRPASKRWRKGSSSTAWSKPVPCGSFPIQRAARRMLGY